MINSISRALDITVSNFKHSEETISFTSETLISKLNLNKTDEPDKVCKKKFGILYPNKLLGKHPYAAELFDTYFASTFYVYTTFPMLISMSWFTLVLGREKLTFSTSFIGILVLIILAFSVFSVFRKVFHRYNMKRTSIWLQCFHQLNISDKVIYKVVPNRYISFLKGDRIKDPISLLISEMIQTLSILIKK